MYPKPRTSGDIISNNFRWLSGLQVVNHRTLSDFRMEHKAELEELFVELLGMLEKEEPSQRRSRRKQQCGYKAEADGFATHQRVQRLLA